MKKGEMHPLRIARCHHGLTIVELAEKAKVGASTIWRAEHDYSINAASRHRLCAYFAMAPDELGLICYEKKNLTFEQKPPISYAFQEVYPPVYLTEKVPGVQLLTSSEGSDSSQLFAKYEQTDVDSVSEEECSQVTEALNRSIAQSRQFCRTASSIQILIAGQGLLYLLKQTRNFLSHESYQSFYEAIIDLIGGALFFQEYRDSSRETPKKVYQVTLEELDIQKQRQGLSQKAVEASTNGKHVEAARFIETALHLLEGQEEEDYQPLHTDRNRLKSFSPVFGQQPSFVDY